MNHHINKVQEHPRADPIQERLQEHWHMRVRPVPRVVSSGLGALFYLVRSTVLWNRYDVRWVRGATIKFPGFSRFKGTFKHWHLTSLIIASKSKDGYVLVDNCLGYNTVSKYMEMDQSFILYSPIHDNIKHNIILKLELQKIQGIEDSDFFKWSVFLWRARSASALRGNCVVILRLQISPPSSRNGWSTIGSSTLKLCRVAGQTIYLTGVWNL